ncbi:8834_t:CDS:2, partial [Funneliformis geosporum]
NILNLQQQILALQNNPPQNMAAVHEIYQMLAPALEQILPALYTHLPSDLRNSVKIYMTIRGAGNQTVDNFFADLRKYWVEPKLTKLIKVDTIDTKSARYRYSESSNYNNGGLEKRIEQIEANLAKFVRKDTRSAKTSQRQCSESSPFGGLEKRLDQIESLIAKLVKESKSRSGRIHMATVDEQSNPIFSDDDTLKPKDNDYNSDNSSAGSDDGKRDTHVYISHEKKSELC